MKMESEVQRLARLLGYPLSNVKVLMALKRTLDQMEKTAANARERGLADESVRREGVEAIHQMIIVIHEASGALLQGLESGGEAELSEVKVKRSSKNQRRNVASGKVSLAKRPRRPR